MSIMKYFVCPNIHKQSCFQTNNTKWQCKCLTHGHAIHWCRQNASNFSSPEHCPHYCCEQIQDHTLHVVFDMILIISLTTDRSTLLHEHAWATPFHLLASSHFDKQYFTSTAQVLSLEEIQCIHQGSTQPPRLIIFRKAQHSHKASTQPQSLNSATKAYHSHKGLS